MNLIAYENIFDVITDSPEEASELQTRSDLMIAIRDIIEKESWTLVQTAQTLGLTQSRVSDFKKGKIETFSIELLRKIIQSYFLK